MPETRLPGESVTAQGSPKRNRPAVFLLAGAFLLICVAARDTLRFWWWEYTAPDSYYSHAFLVPAMMGVIFWAHRDRSAEVQYKPFYPALLLVACFGFANVEAAQREMQAIMSYTLMGLIVSSAWAVFGSVFVWREKVAFMFLAAMLPLPGPLLNDMTFGMQNISTSQAAWLLNHIGFQCAQSGHQITMQDFVFLVDTPCSGFKTLMALLTFDAFFAYLLNAPAYVRWILFLAGIPLSITANVVRISLIGIVGECLSDHAAKMFHDFSGIIVIAGGMAALFGFARALGCRKFAGLSFF